MATNLDSLVEPNVDSKPPVPMLPAGQEKTNSPILRHEGGEATRTVLGDGSPDTDGPGGSATTTQRSLAFWMIILGLGITLLLSAFENTILTTAAPAILAEFDLGGNWIWVTNAFFLGSAAFQPLTGQLANVFGRRWLTLCIVAIFMLGSGICAGATSGRMLTAGRAVQGIGSGGILQSFDMIVSDLVPLRGRGNYVAVIMLIYTVGTTLGPIIGGAFGHRSSWRWCFYINLPVGGASLLILFLFLRVRSPRDAKTRWITRIVRGVDIIGNMMLIGGTTAMLVALSYAGNPYPWSSWHTLVPLVIGFGSFFLLAAWESSALWAQPVLGRVSGRAASFLVRWAPREPLMPPRLFASRTSVIVAVNTFLYTASIYLYIFFLPVYFQTVKLASPVRAGVDMLPVTLSGVPAAAAAGVILSRFGRFKAIHLVGFAMFAVGAGLYTRLDRDTPVGEWVGYELVASIGGGLLLNSQLPAFQAPVDEADQAVATGAWNFLRTLGGVWGVAIPAAVFASRIDALVANGAIADADPAATALLTSGGAYGQASAAFVQSFSDQATRDAVRSLYRLGCQRVFQVAISFVAVCFLLALVEKDIKLRTVLETDFGLEEDKNTPESKAESRARDGDADGPC